ncbi:MAG TPA: SdpI family protein [Aggregatilineales bacterium]|nr:SdpI family protein [Aggregatilineales bacterium]
MSKIQLLMLVYIVLGLVVAGLGVPLVLRRIKPNPFYGVRLGRTMKDEKMWYAVNAYVGRWLVALGLLTAILALVVAAFPGISILRYTLTVLGIVGVGTIAAMVFSWRYIRSLDH